MSLLGTPDGDAVHGGNESSALYVYRGTNAGYFIACRESLWHKTRELSAFVAQIKGACESLIMERLRPLVRMPGRIGDGGHVELYSSAEVSPKPAEHAGPAKEEVRAAMPLILLLGKGQELDDEICPLAERLALRPLPLGRVPAGPGYSLAIGHAKLEGQRWVLDRSQARRKTAPEEALLAILGARLRFGDSLDLGVDAVEQLVSRASSLEVGEGELGADTWAVRSAVAPPRRLPDLTGQVVRERRATGVARALEYPLVRAGLIEREVPGGVLLMVPGPLEGHHSAIVDPLSRALLGLCDGETRADWIGEEYGAVIGVSADEGRRRFRAHLEHWRSLGLLASMRLEALAT